MQAISDISIGPPMPQISKLVPMDKLRVTVEWKDGIRKGKTDIVDLSPLVKSFKYYKSLLKPAVFAKARLEDDGQAIAWVGDVDMAAVSVERLAEEGMDAEEFRSFLKSLDLTQEQAAALLGYGRRQVAHFLAGTKAIPRVVALACRRLLDTRTDNKEVMLSWSSESDSLTALFARSAVNWNEWNDLTRDDLLPHHRHRVPVHPNPQTHVLMWQMTRSARLYGT